MFFISVRLIKIRVRVIFFDVGMWVVAVLLVVVGVGVVNSFCRVFWCRFLRWESMVFFLKEKVIFFFLFVFCVMNMRSQGQYNYGSERVSDRGMESWEDCGQGGMVDFLIWFQSFFQDFLFCEVFKFLLLKMMILGFLRFVFEYIFY